MYQKSISICPADTSCSFFSPWWMPNGGTKFGKINNVTEFDGRDIFGEPGQPKSTGANGNRGGHNVTDNDFIFNISAGQPGYVAPRKDTNMDPSVPWAPHKPASLK